MQFRVPQFIDIEDKILGPLTWKQAAYCLGAIGSIYISFRLTSSNIIGFIFAAPLTVLFLSLAFVKVNNRNFVDVLENAFKFYTNARLYTWQKKEEMVAISPSNVDISQKGKLTELSSLINIKKAGDEEEEDKGVK